jgi:phenylpropionate dioxygenase-like ring-hydroxylating dioxygenase large terminal subunit
MGQVDARANRSTRNEADHGFHQSWYPLGLCSELQAGAVLGRDFLGTRVVLYRDPTGKAVVQSAYCPHLGADLSVGQLVEGRIRCAYHHWSFGADGICAHIPTGDKIPPGAKIFTYPSAEAWGLIWAFNGAPPLFDPPRIPGGIEADLAFEAHIRGPRPFDPWVAVSNGVDFQHLRTLHGLPTIAFPERIEVEDYGIEFRIEGNGYLQHGRITGTNSFAQHLRMGGNDLFMLFTGASVDHGKAFGYFVIGVPKPAASGEAAERATQEKLRSLHAFVDKLNEDDAPVLSSIRFRKGVLVVADRHLARYFKYVEEFPRALPPDA